MIKLFNQKLFSLHSNSPRRCHRRRITFYLSQSSSAVENRSRRGAKMNVNKITIPRNQFKFILMIWDAVYTTLFESNLSFIDTVCVCFSFSPLRMLPLLLWDPEVESVLASGAASQHNKATSTTIIAHKCPRPGRARRRDIFNSSLLLLFQIFDTFYLPHRRKI